MLDFIKETKKSSQSKQRNTNMHPSNKRMSKLVKKKFGHRGHRGCASCSKERQVDKRIRKKLKRRNAQQAVRHADEAFVQKKASFRGDPPEGIPDFHVR